MNENQNWNVGDQIKDALQDALDTGDFKNLNQVVAGTVSSALTEAKRQMKAASENITTGTQTSRREGTPPGPGPYYKPPGNQFGNPGNAAQGTPGNGANPYTAQPGGPTMGGQHSGSNQNWNGNPSANANQFQGMGSNIPNGRQGAVGGQGGAGSNGGAGGRGGYAGQMGGSWSQGQYHYNNWNNVGKKDTFHYKKHPQTGNFYNGMAQATKYVQKAYRTYQNNQRNVNKQTNVPRQNYAQQMPNLPSIKTKKVGQISGTLYLVFGGIGTGIMGLVLAIITILFVTSEITSIWPLFFVGIFLLGFLGMIERGCVKKERLKRARRYVELCDGKTYINIEDLSMHIAKSRRFVLKDVKRMLKLGIFPEGHLDEKETCLMLDDATYREYLKIQKERKVQAMEDKMAKMREKQKQPTPAAQTNEQAERAAAQVQAAKDGVQVNIELEDMIADGQECIRRLRDMNDAIDGEGISAKLFQMENLLKEIFERVREHPEQMPQMHKFMDYYLPTTMKLVQAYAEFDSMSVPGEDILSAKSEIEKTLDTINSAFTELLNNLYRDSVFDVTTDAQVLQTMLAKEGLTREMEKVPR